MGSPDQVISTTTQDAAACEKIRLTDAGLRGLAAACRSAFEMVTVACNEANNVSLWLRLTKEMHTIDETRYAYDLLKKMREKHFHCSRQALEASVALRDVLVLMIINVYASFDTGFEEMTKLAKRTAAKDY